MTDIMGKEIEVGDLLCSSCGWRKILDVRMVRKITPQSIIYTSLNGVRGCYNLRGVPVLKVPKEVLTKEMSNAYDIQLKKIKKNVATADNT